MKTIKPNFRRSKLIMHSGNNSNLSEHLCSGPSLSRFLKTAGMAALLILCGQTGNAQNALHFADDSTHDYVSIPNVTALNLGTGRFTMEAVVKMPKNQIALFPTILSKRVSNSTSSPGFTFYIAGNKLAFQIGGSNTNAVGPDLFKDSCYHLAVVRDSAGKITGYVNGVAYTMSNVNNGNMSNSDPLLMGWDDAEATLTQFYGAIDEVRIWNLVRTSAQINAYKNTVVSPTSTGLVAYYKFNQGTAGGNNTSISTIQDAASSNTGNMIGFAKTGSISNFVKSCIDDKSNTSCDYFKLDVQDTNCCSAGIVRTMAGGSNVVKVRFNIIGGVAQGYTTNCPGGLPVSANVGGFSSRTITFSPCNMLFFTTSLQSTTASGNMTVSYTVIFANGDSCIYKTDVVGCPRAPKTNCDRLIVAPYTYVGLDLSGRTFTILNTKIPSSLICKILISLTPAPSTGWQGGGVKCHSYGSSVYTPPAGSYFASPYVVIPGGTGSPWLSFSPNTNHYVKFNLGVDFTIGWTGAVNIKVIHCDGDTCTLTYSNWVSSHSNSHTKFTTTQKINDSLYAVSLTLGLPSIKSKSIKWLGVEVMKGNSEIFSVTGGRYGEKATESSNMPMESSHQSDKFALFEFENSVLLDGTDSQLPINLVFKGQRPALRLIGFDENGNEIISDTMTVKREAAKVQQMRKMTDDKIGISLYPNPSSSTVSFSYYLDEASDVEFSITDMSGSFIQAFTQGKKAAGNYEFKIDNSGFAPGTYIVKMKTEKYSKSVIMIIAK